MGENNFLEDFAETVKTKIATALEPLEQLTARAQVGQPAREAANEKCITAPQRKRQTS